MRAFFHDRGVLEVDTPLIGSYPSAEPHLHAVACQPFGSPQGRGSRDHYLQTSPESALKRLLAAGSGPVYQLGKAFRAGELGSQHQPEFTMLEWYRPGWTLDQLLDEVHALVVHVLRVLGYDEAPGRRVVTYEELWREHLQVDPHTAAAAQLAELAEHHLDENQRPPDLSTCDSDTLLGLLMSQSIEPTFSHRTATYVFDFPACQAAMAACTTRSDGAAIAKRFELYLGGFEIANAYWELTDAEEQQRRLVAGLERQPERSVDTDLDHPLIDALRAGLPSSSGVALGFDRLLMAALSEERIERVIPFPVVR